VASSDAGAPEIEITDEMLTAGLAAYSLWDRDDPREWQVIDIAGIILPLVGCGVKPIITTINLSMGWFNHHVRRTNLRRMEQPPRLNYYFGHRLRRLSKSPPKEIRK
jgi:hypothetical protein